MGVKNEVTPYSSLLAVACAGVHVAGKVGSGLKGHELEMSKVWDGEVWRVVTGPLMHGGLPHLLLNVMGLCSTGASFEKRWGGRGIAELWALIAATECVAQKVFESIGLNLCPVSAVGISGVLFGMRGALIAVQARKAGVRQTASKEVYSLAYGVLCLAGLTHFGLLGEVDHFGHACGYVAGLVFGWSIP